MSSVRDPTKIRDEIYFRCFSNAVNSYYQRKLGEGISVIDEDWDNLIILDACRFDTFEQHANLAGELKSVVSKGSNSPEFMEHNFAGKSLHDTVYVTGNPHIEGIGDAIFHNVVKSYRSSGKNIDKVLHGYDPEVIFDLAVETHSAYPQKRLIVHFMQPHIPFLGEKASRIRDQLRTEHGIIFRQDLDNPSDWQDESVLSSLLVAAEEGYIQQGEVWDLYVENLQVGLKYVNRTIDAINGKTVVTSDHGELLGQKSSMIYPRKRRFRHPKGKYFPELRVVPWLEIDSDNRREIVSEDPIKPTAVPEEAVEDNLKDLGYLG